MGVPSWTGTMVRHLDGRSGKISDDWPGFLHVGLKIAVDGGGEAFVQLNSNGPDTGEKGWAWLCTTFTKGPAWLPLGDHNDFDAQIVGEHGCLFPDDQPLRSAERPSQ